jgi:hypothetical protein
MNGVICIFSNHWWKDSLALYPYLGEPRKGCFTCETLGRLRQQALRPGAVPVGVSGDRHGTGLEVRMVIPTLWKRRLESPIFASQSPYLS